MAKIKKPAPKGGTKNAAPKKARERARSADFPPITQTVADAIAAFDAGGVVLREEGERGFLNQPKHPTVEEQWPQYQIVVQPKPSIWRRFRSAITGLFVSKQFAEAHPDTTVREKA